MIARLSSSPHALGLAVLLDGVDQLVVAAGEPEVLEGPVVDREESDGGAVLGRHVGDRRPVGHRHVGQAGAVELDELVDDTVLAEHLGDSQDQVGGG